MLLRSLGARAVGARVRDVLSKIRDANCVIDVNARGFRACGEQYPAGWILEIANEIGVPVTFGDDSHSPSDVGADLDRAAGALRRAGYTSIALVRADRTLDHAPI